MIFRFACRKCLRKVPYLQHNVPFNNFYLLHNVTESGIMKKKKTTKLDLLRKSDKTENLSDTLGPLFLFDLKSNLDRLVTTLFHPVA